MALVINTNLSSLVIQRQLSTNTLRLNKSIERLSSGLRINHAADDAAGLAISEKLGAHIRSINQAIRNAQDGVSLLQVAEGALGEIGNILARLRELAMEAASGTVGDEEKSALDNEFQQLLSEIDRISNVTEFNGTYLLDGSESANGISIQVGFRSSTDNVITVLSGVDAVNTTTLNLNGTTISVADSAQSVLDAIDSAISTVAQRRGTLGAVQNRLEITISNLRVAAENLTAARSRIRDADFAYETAEFTKVQILVQSGTAVLAQANVLPQTALQLLR